MAGPFPDTLVYGHATFGCRAVTGSDPRVSLQGSPPPLTEFIMGWMCGIAGRVVKDDVVQQPIIVSQPNMCWSRTIVGGAFPACFHRILLETVASRGVAARANAGFE